MCIYLGIEFTFFVLYSKNFHYDQRISISVCSNIFSETKLKAIDQTSFLQIDNFYNNKVFVVLAISKLI